MTTRLTHERPHILIRATPVAGLHTVASLREAVKQGGAKLAWEALLDIANREAGEPPLLPGSMCPGRSEMQACHENPDWAIVNAVCHRVQYAALAHLLAGDPRHRDSALLQLESLFDARLWPDWRDKAHRYNAADLRTGALCGALSMAYDWLAPALSAGQRAWIVEGLDRCGIQPYLRAVKEKAGFVEALTNWTTCVVGGLGITGMALGDDHPQSKELIDIALPRMERYLAEFGSEGEFNESVGYANATQLAVEFYLAHRYWTGGGENRLARAPFPQFGRWLMAMTLPPGRIAALGDGHVNAPPVTVQCAAIAAAARDPMLQGFWNAYPEPPGDRRDWVKTLLWPDPGVEVQSPAGRLPKGRVYAAHGMVYSSRSDWNPRSTACVVYGKGGCGGETHGHHDAGQVCIDGFGRRLIIDPGNPSLYPADFFSPHRWRYYNASAWGHNVLTFDGADQRPDASARARWTSASFDDERGGGWILDLTGNYVGVKVVRRTLLHLLPGVVAVLDEAALPDSRAISLRWHTADRGEPDAVGRFMVRNEGVRLAARVAWPGGLALALRRGEQAYEAPFDKGRLGEPLEQRRESFVEAALSADRCRLLTLFAVLGPDEPDAAWDGEGGRWTLQTARGPAVATWDGARLELAEAGRHVSVETGDPRTA